MKVAIYARVSTPDKNQNPETQLRPLRQHLAGLKDVSVVGEFIDKAGASGCGWARQAQPLGQERPERLVGQMSGVDPGARRASLARRRIRLHPQAEPTGLNVLAGSFRDPRAVDTVHCYASVRSSARVSLDRPSVGDTLRREPLTEFLRCTT